MRPVRHLRHTPQGGNVNHPSTNETASAPRTLHPGLLQWFITGDMGMAARDMAAHLSGRKRQGSIGYPWDFGDFHRCERLLRAVPTLRAELPRMRECQGVWERLVDRWDDIVAAAEEEHPGVFDGPVPTEYPFTAREMVKQARP